MAKFVIAFALIAMVALAQASPLPVLGALGQGTSQVGGVAQGAVETVGGLSAGLGLGAGVGLGVGVGGGLNADAATKAVGGVTGQAGAVGQGVGGLGL